MSFVRSLVGLALASSAAIGQHTWYVDASAPGAGNGTTQSPYSSLQYAIDQPQTVSGDTLSLAPGIYAEHVRFFGKSIAVVGAQGLTVTFLQPSVTNTPLVQWVDGEGPGTRLEGLTLRNNTMSFAVGGGAGLRCTGARGQVLNCRFLNCDTIGSAGGAIEVSASPDLRVADSRFEGCSAFRDSGGAIASGGSHLVIERTSFAGCVCGGFGGARGGALSAGGGSVVVLDSTFSSCLSDGGGAIGATSVALTMTKCSIVSCGADGIAGGVFLNNSTAHFAECLFRSNWGGSFSNVGAALYSNTVSTTTLTRCEFIENGSSFSTTQSVVQGATLERCSIVGNATYEFGSSGVVNNCVLNSCVVWGNLPPIGPLTASTATYSNIEGGHSGLGNIATPPSFVDRAGGDLRLLPGSPCIDTGDPALPLDSDGTRADMGARAWTPQIERYCTAKTSSAGCVPTIQWSGRPSFLTNDFVLSANQVINNRVGLLFWGVSAVSLPFAGGVLCVEPFARTPIQLSGGSASGIDCSGSWSFPFDAAYMNARGLAPDDVVFAQYWGRDPGFAFPSSVMLSDAVRFVVEH